MSLVYAEVPIYIYHVQHAFYSFTINDPDRYLTKIIRWFLYSHRDSSTVLYEWVSYLSDIGRAHWKDTFIFYESQSMFISQSCISQAKYIKLRFSTLSNYWYIPVSRCRWNILDASVCGLCIYYNVVWKTYAHYSTRDYFHILVSE